MGGFGRKCALKRHFVRPIITGLVVVVVGVDKGKTTEGQVGGAARAKVLLRAWYSCFSKVRFIYLEPTT